MKRLEWIISFVCWLQILLFPTFLGVVGALVIYHHYPSNIGLGIAIAFGVLGLTKGIIIAIKIWKKRGTIDVLARIHASPDIGDKE